MNILIIGAKGFIGSHAVRYFESKGAHVIGCDVTKLPNASFPYHVVDRFEPDYAAIFASHDLDFCINASGNANVSQSASDPVYDFRLNALNTLYMLDAIRKHRPRCQYVNLSSAAVYGNPQQLPVYEAESVVPVSPYGWHKYYTELMCREYYTLHKVRSCSLRIFSVYGPGLQKQLFWDIFQKSRQSLTVTLFGTGRESRDFIYITDLLRAVEVVMQRCAMEGNIINVSSGIENTIQEAASLFLNHLGNGNALHFSGEDRPGDPKNWRADIGTLQALGFAPTMPLSEGLNNYAAWLTEKN